MDVLEAIKTRRSVRDYSAKPIPDDIMERMRQALRFAPSACNLQPWRFIFVADHERRRKLAETANDQIWIASAPVVVAACGLPAVAYKYMGGSGNSVEIDVAIALDHLTLAAVSEGLATCWIGAFHEASAKALLHIPDSARLIAMTPLGYPAKKELNYPLRNEDRKPSHEVFCAERYSTPLR
jgi:nitroreductase